MGAALIDAVRPCGICGNLDSRGPCSICADRGRDRTIICVTEGVGDVWALERASIYRGLYHVLGGGLSEVILALGATVDGATTAHWLTERLRRVAPDLVITRVGQGVPIGGALDVLDDGTLAAALRGRRA